MLINCPECNSNVSDQSTKCVSCGIQLKEPKRGFFGTAFKWLFVVFNVLMLLLLIMYMVGTNDIFANMVDQVGLEKTINNSTMGFLIVLGTWMAGDIILGMLVLFTRPRD